MGTDIAVIQTELTRWGPDPYAAMVAAHKAREERKQERYNALNRAAVDRERAIVAQFEADRLAELKRKAEAKAAREAAIVAMVGAMPHLPITQNEQIKRIIQFTAEHFGVRVSEIVGQRRLAYIVLPRQVAMYLARGMTTKSLPQMGLHFGGKDHTTILSAIAKIMRLIERDEAFRATIAELTAKIKA